MTIATLVWGPARQCLFCQCTLEDAAPEFADEVRWAPLIACPGGHGPFYLAEVRARQWLVGQSERGTPTFGEHWPVVARGIEIELRSRYADLDAVAAAAAAARHIAGWFSTGRTAR